MTPRCWWRRGHLSRTLSGSQVEVPHGIVTNSELEHSAEHESAAAGGTTVEAEHELIEVALQMRLVEPALVGTEQPSLRQRCDPMHTRQECAHILAGSARRALAPLIMRVAEISEPVVALPGVGDHFRAPFDVIGHERVERSGPIGENCHPAPAEPLGFFDLDGQSNQGFLRFRPSATEPRLLATDVGLVNLNGSREQVPARTHECRPQSVQHRPRCLVGADFKAPLEAESRDAVLGGGEQPASGEPDRERRTRPIEDRASGHRGAMATASAHDPSVAQPPAPRVLTLRADEPLWPAQRLEVVQAGGIGPEPCLELPKRSRVVRTATGVVHSRKLLRLNGEPEGEKCGN